MKKNKKIYFLLLLPLFLILLSGCTKNEPVATNTPSVPINNSTTPPAVTPIIETTSNQVSTVSPAITKTEVTTTPAPKKVALNLTEITKHNTANNCWQAIDGQVYDLSPYVQSGVHPGGDKILNGCGKDASLMFKMIGKHNNGARDLLPPYLLGALQP